MINLFFVIHDHSGARTYANQLLDYLSTHKDINIYKVHLESNKYKEYTIIKEENITVIHIPKIKRMDGTLTKLAKRQLDIMHPFLEKSTNIVFHLNHGTQVKLGIEARKRYGAGILYTLHYLPNYFSLLSRQYINYEDLTITGDALDKECANEADRIICVTRFASEMLQKHYKIDLKKLHVIYNGTCQRKGKNTETKIKKTILKQQLGFSKCCKIILFVGRIMNGKGVEALIAAFNRLCKDFHDSQLILVGEGDFNHYMEIARDNIGRIRFTGKLPFKEVAQLYEIADLGVVPSEYEQCSYVALEMMEHGVPIVATNVPGMGELFADKENALLANLKERKNNLLGLEVSEESLFEKIKLLLEKRELAKRLAINGRKSWENHYTAKRMGKETYRLYQDVLSIGKKELQPVSKFNYLAILQYGNNPISKYGNV